MLSRVVLFLLACDLAVSAQAAEPPERAGGPKRVLVVHSFGTVAPPFTTHSVAFETELVEKMGERVDLDEVSLDMARYAEPNLQEALVDYLVKRQAHWQPDLVVPIGSPAGVLVAQYRDRLFPNTPILYTGMDLPPATRARNRRWPALPGRARRPGVRSHRRAHPPRRAALEFPTQNHRALPPRYDGRELDRWKISEDRLPAGTVVLFREQTTWKQYGVWIIAGVTICLVQTLLIFGLVANLAKRRHAEHQFPYHRG